jgi:hypothetical protein
MHYYFAARPARIPHSPPSNTIMQRGIHVTMIDTILHMHYLIYRPINKIRSRNCAPMTLGGGDYEARII